MWLSLWLTWRIYNNDARFPSELTRAPIPLNYFLNASLKFLFYGTSWSFGYFDNNRNFKYMRHPLRD